VNLAPTVSVPSSPSTSSARTRDGARRNTDGPSGPNTGFDTALASHAAPGRSPRAPSRPDAATQPDHDRRSTTRASNHAAKGVPAPKRARDSAPGAHDAAPPALGRQTESPVADPAPPITADTTAAGTTTADPTTTSSGGTQPGSDLVVPVLPATATAGTPAVGATVPADGVAAVGAGSAAGTIGPVGAGAGPPSHADRAAAGTPATPTPPGPDATGAAAAPTGPDTASPAQPNGAAQATPAPSGADAAPAAGTPTGSGLVVPVLPAPVQITPGPTVSATPAAGQPTPPAVHEQVLTAVSPLLRGADGSYGVQLRLHPEDLGAVQVNVDVRHGEISIRLHATNEAARDALRSGLSDLRQQLEDQGLRAGSMEVGSGGANAQQRETSWSRSQHVEVPRGDPTLSDQPVTTAAAAPSSVLDLRM